MAAIPMKKWSTLRKVLFSIQTFKWSALIYAAGVVFLASKILYGITVFRQNAEQHDLCYLRSSQKETKQNEQKTKPAVKTKKTVSSGD
jgi:hypothetical protein